MWTDHSAITPQLQQEDSGNNRWVNGTVAMQQGSHEQVVAGRGAEPRPQLRHRGASGRSGGQRDRLWQAHIWTDRRVVRGEGRRMGVRPLHGDRGRRQADGPHPGVPGPAPRVPTSRKLRTSRADLVQAQIEPASWPLTVTNTDPAGVWGIVSSQDGIAPALEDIFLNRKTASDALERVVRIQDRRAHRGRRLASTHEASGDHQVRPAIGGLRHRDAGRAWPGRRARTALLFVPAPGVRPAGLHRRAAGRVARHLVHQLGPGGAGADLHRSGELAAPAR